MTSATGPVDWAELRRRADAAWQATERGWSPPPEERRRILHQRANALAAERAEVPTGPAPIGILTFSLGGERYGLELLCVRAVFPLRSFTPLPCTPPFVFGLANLRGQLLSILDLRRLFDTPAQAPSEQNRLIVVQHDEMELALLAEAVLGVSAIHADALQPLPPTVTGVREAFARGVTAERLVLLDTVRILSDNRIMVDENVEG